MDQRRAATVVGGSNDTSNMRSKTAPTPEQIRVLRAAIEGLSIHAEMCGHRRIDPECPYCDDQTTVAAARKALAAIA